MPTTRPPVSIEAQLRTRAFARVVGPYVATFTILYAIRSPACSSGSWVRSACC
jgi:hypothetical protein